MSSSPSDREISGLLRPRRVSRLVPAGEAVKDIAPDLLANEPDIPWRDVARMRDHLAHRYFDTDHAIVGATVEHDLPPLVGATERLRRVARAQG